VGVRRLYSDNEWSEESGMGTSAYLTCDVSAGVFSSERVASINGVDGVFEALVDSEDILFGEGGNSSRPAKLRVLVINKQGNTLLVELPRETFQGARRVKVSSDLVDRDPIVAV
jgi:hypothetical protein